MHSQLKLGYMAALALALGACGPVGYYRAESEHSAEAETNASTDAQHTCRLLLQHTSAVTEGRRAPTQKELDRYLDCILGYEPTLIDSDTAQAAADAVSAVGQQQQEQGDNTQ